MADSYVAVTEGSGKNIDTRTTTTAGDHRQVIVVGDSSVDNAVAGVVSADPGAASSAYGQIVRLAGSATVQIAGSSGSLAVYFDRGNPSVTVDNRVDIGRVFNVVDGTISLPSSQDLDTITRVDRVMNVVDGTIGIGRPDINRVFNVVDGTISLPSTQSLDTITRIDRVMNVVDGTISLPSTQDLDTITRIDRVINVVDGTISVFTARPDINRVHNVVDGSINITNRPDINRVFNVIDGTIGIGRPDINRVFNVVDGTITVASLKGLGSTANIYYASGSSAAATASGITVIAPSANYSFKVFAYSIQTTGVLASALTFANGSAASQTEFWRPLVACGGSGTQSTTPIGANLAVTPPGYLFATGTNTTLVIANNNGSTIHYSVGYIKETS